MLPKKELLHNLNSILNTLKLGSTCGDIVPIFGSKLYVGIAFAQSANPVHLVLRLHFLRIHSFGSQRYLVLFIIVNRRHLLHYSQEHRDGVFREVGPGISVLVLT